MCWGEYVKTESILSDLNQTAAILWGPKTKNMEYSLNISLKSFGKELNFPFSLLFHRQSSILRTKHKSVKHCGTWSMNIFTLRIRILEKMWAPWIFKFAMHPYCCWWNLLPVHLHLHLLFTKPKGCAVRYGEREGKATLLLSHE